MRQSCHWKNDFGIFASLALAFQWVTWPWPRPPQAATYVSLARTCHDPLTYQIWKMSVFTCSRERMSLKFLNQKCATSPWQRLVKDHSLAITCYGPRMYTKSEVSIFVPELGGGPEFKKWVAWPCPRLLKGHFIFHLLILTTVHLITNFEMYGLNYIGPFSQF